ATSVKKELKSTYGEHSMKTFEGDIEHIVDALINGKYDEFNKQKLREVAKFGRTDQDNAEIIRDRLNDGNAPSKTDTRTLLVGARLAYTKDPQKYKEMNAHQLVLDAVPAARTPGVRAEAQQKLTPEQIKAANDADRKAGERLYDTLRRRSKRSKKPVSRRPRKI